MSGAPDYLVPPRALAKLVRGMMMAALRKRLPDLVMPEAAWRKAWVVHCTSWGDVADAVILRSERPQQWSF